MNANTIFEKGYENFYIVIMKDKFTEANPGKTSEEIDKIILQELTGLPEEIRDDVKNDFEIEKK